MLLHEKIRVQQSAVGGAFGGKEEFPTLTAGYTALLAMKCGKPVKMIYDRHQDILWFNKEAFEQLLYWLLNIVIIDVYSTMTFSDDEKKSQIIRCYDIITRWIKASTVAEYQVEKLLEEIKSVMN